MDAGPCGRDWQITLLSGPSHTSVRERAWSTSNTHKTNHLCLAGYQPCFLLELSCTTQCQAISAITCSPPHAAQAHHVFKSVCCACWGAALCLATEATCHLIHSSTTYKFASFTGSLGGADAWAGSMSSMASLSHDAQWQLQLHSLAPIVSRKLFERERFQNHHQRRA
jgi:hypothetical protein